MKSNRTRYQQGSLTIEDRKNGPSVYVYRWRENVGGAGVKRKKILGTVKELTKTQAQREADLLRQSINAPAPVRDASLSVAELAVHYSERELTDAIGKTVKVRKAYRYILDSYVLPQWGKYPLGAVKAVEVESWLRSLPKANGTKAKIREVFGAVFRHGMRHELVAQNPITHVRQVRKRASDPSILEPAELGLILAELEGLEPVRTAFLVAAATGMRRGELFGLQWADVDFARAVLHIRRSMVDGVEGPPKTDSSRRPIPMPSQVVTALQVWRQRSEYTTSTDWVFASENTFGKLPFWPGTLWRRNIAPAIERAGITKPKLGWHTLRRGYASLLLSSGASLRTSMELMRHSTPNMTLGLYAQTVGNDKRDAGTKVANLVLGTGLVA